MKVKNKINKMKLQSKNNFHYQKIDDNTTYNKRLPLNYIDINGMVLVRNRDWNINGNHGKRDCLSRTILAYLTYNDERLLTSALNCVKPVRYNNIMTNDITHYQLHRYPVSKQDEDWQWNFSRDHAIILLCVLVLTGHEADAKRIGKNLRSRLSIRFKKLPVISIWVKGFNKKLPILYFIYMSPGLIYSALLNKFLRFVGNIKSSKSVEDFLENRRKPNKFQKILSKIIQPVYARELVAWQVYTLRKSFIKRIMQKLVMLDVEKSNYLIRALCEDKNLTDDEVNSYKPTTTYRWSMPLDCTCDRDFHLFDEINDKSNGILEHDLLHKIYFK